MIDNFRDKYYFLSNFYPCVVMHEGILYASSEAAFQAAKTFNPNDRLRFCTMDGSTSKKEGRRLKLRSDWEDVKDGIMLSIIKDKFTRNPTLKKKLLATGNKTLIEGNTWGDRYWGMVNGVGKNKLGKILMRVRDEFFVTGLTENLKNKL